MDIPLSDAPSPLRPTSPSTPPAPAASSASGFKAPQIPPQDRIPLGQKITFSVGAYMDYVATTLTTTIWMPFFNIGLGCSPGLLGGILMILRSWDAVTDPIMGNITDNARTRWGRRRPFIFVGAIVTALLFPLFWHVPESVRAGALAPLVSWLPFVGSTHAAGELSLAVYLTLLGLVFFTSFTVWSMPFYGLQLELTPNYDERTRLTAWMTLFNKFASLGGAWLLAIVMFTGALALGQPSSIAPPAFLQRLIEPLQPWLASLAQGDVGEKPIVVGMRLLAWPFAAAVLCFGVLPALFVRERYYKAEASTQPRDPFWKSLRESARCRPLWSLISISFFLVLGYTSIGALGQYVNFYYVCGGDVARGAVITGLKGTVIVISGLASLPFFTWLGEKYDKRVVVASMLGCCVVGHLLNFFLMTPANPYLQIIPGVLEAAGISAVWLFLPSMKADVADYDELDTHRRREGSINAFYSWFMKASLTCSMGIGGAVLQFSGFDAAKTTQPDAVLSRMFALYLLLPAVIWVAAFISVWFYPLTRQRCAQIRTDLEARRGAL